MRFSHELTFADLGRALFESVPVVAADFPECVVLVRVSQILEDGLRFALDSQIGEAELDTDRDAKACLTRLRAAIYEIALKDSASAR